MRFLRSIWKEHRTGITFFSGALLSLLYGSSHFLWRENRSFYDIIELTSLFIPVAAAIVTFIAGGIDMALWFSDNERNRLKKENRRIKKQIKKLKGENKELKNQLSSKTKIESKSNDK